MSNTHSLQVISSAADFQLLKASWDDDGTAPKKTQQLSAKTEDPKDRLSKDFAKSIPEEKKAKWAATKKEQKEFVADVRKEWRETKAEGDLRRYAGAAGGS